ncbi:MAG: hypothetical protein PHE89_00555 [Alphaproteobacteria bacterium]|nr:hypothetical protein [Alphaproteobacteria bacterium]
MISLIICLIDTIGSDKEKNGERERREDNNNNNDDDDDNDDDDNDDDDYDCLFDSAKFWCDEYQKLAKETLSPLAAERTILKAREKADMLGLYDDFEYEKEDKEEDE